MKTEREMFLYELEGRGFIFKNKTWIHGLGDVGGLFDDDQLNMVWEMWCASAQRQGYKLVPVEPTIAMVRAYYETPKPTASRCYQAMIGVSE